SQVSAGDFAAMLVDLLRMKGLVVGPDFALGKDRQGDVNFLREKGAELGFWVEAVEPLEMTGEMIKSRRIRASLESGDVSACAQMLGRKFSLQGVVVEGDHRGKELGFPTANLDVSSRMVLPGDGIYATWATTDGVRRPSATSIGVRPTFEPSERLVEVYVMDFNENLYGKTMTVEFVSKTRGQEAFPSIEALVDQIGQDVADCRVALAEDARAGVA
ncbi:MAG: hypothetical protein IH962_03185, partial [Chloroflexi bacterium]|nr:hypothetical protein [Chloroflexota bacterium]